MRPTRLALSLVLAACAVAHAGNPIIQDRFTADPGAMVYKDRVYLYTGHDEATPEDKDFRMKEWLCFSTDDMVNWKDEGSPMSVKTFAWAGSNAWASQVIERDGKFYWYCCVKPSKASGYDTGMALAVGVSDSPTGPFTDALGKPLVTNDTTRGAIHFQTHKEIDWDDLDPTVWIDATGQAYLIWGNTKCRIAKLKANMTELDGPIGGIDLPHYTEAPWIHQYKGKYYLSYAYDYPEKIAYATADKIEGPYAFGSIINGLIPKSPTNHQAIIEFKGQWYFIYHTAGLPDSGEFRRSVCVEKLEYDADGKIKPIVMTKEGVKQ